MKIYILTYSNLEGRPFSTIERAKSFAQKHYASWLGTEVDMDWWQSRDSLSWMCDVGDTYVIKEQEMDDERLDTM